MALFRYSDTAEASAHTHLGLSPTSTPKRRPSLSILAVLRFAASFHISSFAVLISHFALIILNLLLTNVHVFIR